MRVLVGVLVGHDDLLRGWLRDDELLLWGRGDDDLVLWLRLFGRD